MTLKCINGHDRCYMGPTKNCPYCERSQPRIWTDTEIEFIKQNYNKIPSAQIAKKFSCNRNQIIGKAHRLGLAIKDKHASAKRRGELLSLTLQASRG